MASCLMTGRKIFKKLPFEVVDPKEDEKPKVNVYGPNGFVFVGPKRYLQPACYKEYGLDVYNFEARPDDVYVVGYPRSGTTLHSEMVWQIANDLDYEEAAKSYISHRFPHLDFSLFSRLPQMKEILEKKDVDEEALDIARKYLELSVDGLSQRKGRRFLKCHLPISLMPPHIFEVGAKVIYCARNPKDVLVSIIHVIRFFQSDRGPKPNIKNWFDDFKNDLGMYCPFFEQVLEAWERRNDKNFLFLFYEDTVRDKRQTIQKIAEFLGKKLSDDQIDGLKDYLSIEKFKNNKSVNCTQMVKLGLAKDTNLFIRRGRPGGWKELFDEEIEREFNELMDEKLKGTNLKFPEE
ncbi:estrogen sulfotransferase-like [Anoplophora glabripennis]|uniref:estrogen sulfotransferase-like n=1 Tax=Anoplophora glabripennis TaxID=217634 RepID=UPI00087585DF|nr:estrogen sulfotransferase-like [Anoplophora glabripennis]